MRAILVALHLHEPASRYHCLREVICGSVCRGEEEAASRRDYLKKVGADQLVPSVIECWNSHMVSLLPDPGKAEKSSYTLYARWLAALNELDSQAYGRVLNKWREAHKRRISLWKAIREQRHPL